MRDNEHGAGMIYRAYASHGEVGTASEFTGNHFGCLPGIALWMSSDVILGYLVSSPCQGYMYCGTKPRSHLTDIL